MPIARRLLAISFLIAFLAGCGSGAKLTPVTGKLTMNGKALKNIKVDFHPDPDKGTTGPGSSGTTDEGGNFTLTCSKGAKPGAIVGHHRVVLTDLDTYGTVFVGRGNYRAEDDKKQPNEVPKIPRFPAIYSDLATTPFTQEVKDGMGPVSFDVKK